MSRRANWQAKTHMLETTHSQIIKGREVAADAWAVLRLEEGEDAASATVREGKVIVPLAVWLAQREARSLPRKSGVSGAAPLTMAVLLASVFQSGSSLHRLLHFHSTRSRP